MVRDCWYCLLWICLFHAVCIWFCQGTEVKAITYSNMQIYNGENGKYELFVIIDIWCRTYASLYLLLNCCSAFRICIILSAVFYYATRLTAYGSIDITTRFYSCKLQYLRFCAAHCRLPAATHLLLVCCCSLLISPRDGDVKCELLWYLWNFSKRHKAHHSLSWRASWTCAHFTPCSWSPGSLAVWSDMVKPNGILREEVRGSNPHCVFRFFNCVFAQKYCPSCVLVFVKKFV